MIERKPLIPGVGPEHEEMWLKGLTPVRWVSREELELEEDDMATMDSGYLAGLLAILHYTAPDGTHPHLVPGGLNSVDSEQSRTTNLGNANMHEGTWLSTQTKARQDYWIFVPKPDLVTPHDAVLHSFVVQHADGYRDDLAPASVLDELTHGVKGD